VILLLAYNWDMFPRLTRVALSMAPLPLSALFGCWALKGNRGHAACEPAALCTAAATATALALVSQIYNIDGSFSAYLLTLLTVTLPLTWIFRSTALAAVQSFFIVSQLGNEAGFLKFALILSIGLCLLGFAFHQLRTAGTWHAALLRCIIGWLLVFLPFANQPDFGDYHHLFAISAAAILLMSLGLSLHRRNFDEDARQKNPWLPAGFAVWLVCFLLAEHYHHFTGLSWGMLIPVGYTAAILLHSIRQRMVYFWLLCATLLPSMYFMFRFITIIMWSAAGIALLCHGLKKKDTIISLMGMGTLFVIAIDHFITSYYGMLPRAITLLLGGVAAASTAIMITRYCRKNDNIPGGAK
jgi:hypothetical protein